MADCVLSSTKESSNEQIEGQINDDFFFWQKGTLFFFINLQMSSKDVISGNLENIQKSVTDMLKTIPVEDFQRC